MTDAWSTDPRSIPTPVFGPTAGVIGGRLYVAGGQGQQGVNDIASLQIYDPVAGWSAGASMPWAGSHRAGAVIDGKLYVAGNVNYLGGTELFVYDPSISPPANPWTVLESMTYSRGGAAAAVLNGELFVLGGHNGSAYVAYVESYNPITHGWTTRAPLSVARAGLRAAVVNGVLYAFGGGNGPSALAIVERYNPGTNTWTTLSPMPHGHYHPAVGVVGGTVYLVSGSDDSGFNAHNDGFTPGVPSAGLVSRWSAEDNASDSVGTNHGTRAGGAAYDLGRDGRAFSMSAEGDAVTLSDAPSLDLTTQMSIAMWVRPVDFEQATGAGLFSRDTGGYILGVYSDAYGISEKRRRLTWGKNGVDETLSTTTLTAGEWHHVVATQANGARRIYIDGVLRGSGGGGNYSPLSTPVLIGAAAGVSGWTFHGRLDEILLYNRALTPAEVEGIRQGAGPPVVDTDDDGDPDVTDPDDDGDDVADGVDAFPLDAEKYAFETTFTCGSAISPSTPGAVAGATIRLIADVGTATAPCPGGGLTVGASGFTLDLNGRTVWGSGVASGIWFRNPFDVVGGVPVGVGGIPSAVTIAGPGTISGFRTGIFVMNFSSTGQCPNDPCVPLFGGQTFTNLTVRSNGILSTAPGSGIDLALTSGNTITGVTVTGNRLGIVLSSSDSNTVEESTATGNTNAAISWGPRVSSGVIVGPPSQGNRVEANVIVDNTTFGVAGGGGGLPPAIPMDSAGGVGNIVASNVMRRNRAGGIGLRAEQGSRIEGNTFEDNGGPGISLAVFPGFVSNQNLFLNNTAHGNGQDPHPPPGGTEPPHVDLADRTTGTGTLGTANTWELNTCGTASPRGLCDVTPPQVTPIVNGTPGVNGLFVGDVSVTWVVSDPQSIVFATSGCEPVWITTDTPGATLTCTADSDGGTTPGSVTIRRDANPPAVAIVSPTTDTLFGSASAVVQVQASDIGGVLSVSIDGINASLVAGTAFSGTWEASVPVSVRALTELTAEVADAAGHTGMASLIVDGDGISATIDLDPLTFSNAFGDIALGGTTSGTIAHREGHVVTVTDIASGGVQASISGSSSTGAGLTTCPSGGSENVGLVRQGTTAAIECVTTTTGTNATSRVTAAPTNSDDRTVIVASNGAFVYLPPGQTVEKGSPITAAPTNTRPVPVELVDANDVVIGWFELNKGESVDVEVSLAENGQPQVVLDVVSGSITFTVFGQTLTIEEGGSHTFTPDSTPPVLVLPGDITVEAETASGAALLYEASATDNIDETVTVTCSAAPGSTFPLGMTSVTCSSTDAAGNAAHGTFTVNVVDTTAPSVAGVSVNRSVLWPANHKMVDVMVSYQVGDAVDAAPVCSLHVVSNEPVNGTGDGDTGPDWDVVDAHRVRLRAERAGSGNGRTYTIDIACTDAAGNRSTAAAFVSVPKSRGR